MPEPNRTRRRISAVGRIVKAAKFVGASSQFLSIADNAALSMGAGVHPTLVAWVYPELTSVSQYVMAKFLTAASNSEYSLQIGSTNLARVQMSDGTTTQTVNGVALMINAWNFYVSTYDGSNINVSVNNGSVVSGAFTTDIQDSTNAFRLGSRSDGATFFTGRLNQVGVAKSVLSANEISELYNGGRGKNFAELSPGLAAKFTAYWDLDDAGGSGATWIDKASTNHLTAGTSAAAPTASLVHR